MRVLVFECARVCVCCCLMIQRWRWRRVASLSCGEKLISQGSHAAEPEARVCVCVSVNAYLRACWWEFCRRVRKMCRQTSWAEYRRIDQTLVLLKAICSEGSPSNVRVVTDSHARTHILRAWVLTSVSSFFLWRQLLTTSVVSRHIVSLSYQTEAVRRYKAHLPHAHSLGC